MFWSRGLRKNSPRREQGRFPVAQSKLRTFWTHAGIMGLWDAVRCALISLLYRARPDDSAFDRQHGTDTAAVFAVRADDPPAPGQVVRSGPTHPAVLRHIFSSLHVEPRDFSFVDFGSGKGRALLCAAAFPFKRIVGVEWSTDLCTVALRNIDIFRSRNPSAPEIEVNCLNVLDYEVPSGPVVVYIFNPFGPKLTRQVFEKIRRHARTTPDRCLVVYAGADDAQLEFVLECFRGTGIQTLRECRTLDLHSSWILGEARRDEDRGGT
jgi:predicted RNA methylase